LKITQFWKKSQYVKKQSCEHKHEPISSVFWGNHNKYAHKEKPRSDKQKTMSDHDGLLLGLFQYGELQLGQTFGFSGASDCRVIQRWPQRRHLRLSRIVMCCDQIDPR
jgi:hypothetical protein